MSPYPIHKGACRCGQVTFQVSGPPLITMACHCTGCQQMTASAFSLSSLYPSDKFEVTSGQPVIGGLHSSDSHHFFCPNCLSWLFSRFSGMDDLVNIRATLLDNAARFTPFLETYISEKLPWVRTPAVHSFEKFPPPEQFPALLADYAAQTA